MTDALQRASTTVYIVKCFRYVDDFIVFVDVYSLQDRQGVIDSVLDVFRTCSKGLKFTFEEPDNGTAQFLDVKLCFMEGHICWTYQPRSKKQILNYASAHFKVVKRGIAANCLRGALQKSCAHKVAGSVQDQVARLTHAGFPMELVATVAESLIKEVKAGKGSSRKEDINRERLRRVAVPYVHRLTHRLKKVGKKCGVEVLATAPGKLMRMCPAVNEEPRQACAKKHGTSFVACKEGVVYRIPLSCGKCYVGQTGRCVNDRLREHRAAVSALAAGGHLADHCRRCPGCTPAFDKTRVLGSARDQTSREIREAFHIYREGVNCVSTPSIALTDKEIGYLRGRMRDP